MPNTFDKYHDQGAKLVEIDSWNENKAIRDEIRSLRFFFVVGNKMVIVVTIVVVVDAQVEQSAQTVLDGID